MLWSVALTIDAQIGHSYVATETANVFTDQLSILIQQSLFFYPLFALFSS